MKFMAPLLGCVMAVAVSSPQAAPAAEFPSAGPLYDIFDLTLTPGWRAEVLGPLFYQQQNAQERTWAVPPLLSYTTNPDVDMEEFDFIYPLFTYDRYGTQSRWQFFQLLNFVSTPMPSENVRNRFTLFPFYFQQRSTDPSQNYTAVFPFYGHLQHRLFRDEISFVMFPAYGQSRKRDVVTDNYLYPCFHLRHGDGLSGWQFWPFLGREQKSVTTRTNRFHDIEVVGGHDKRFALWPFYFNEKSGLGTENPAWDRGVIPFYARHESPLRDSTTVLWPFFSRVDDREKQYREWDMPWPLVVRARGEGKTTDRVFPFFSHARSPTLETRFYLWPAYKYERARAAPLDRERTRLFFFLYSDIIERNTDTQLDRRRTDLWPLFTHRRDFRGNTRLQVLAPLEIFTMGSHKIERDYSPVWSVWRAEKNPDTGAASQSLLWNLYRHDTSPSHKKVSLLFGLFQQESGPEGKRTRLFYIPLGKARKVGGHAAAAGGEARNENGGGAEGQRGP